MSNHVHIIARSEKGILSDTIRDLKKYTASNIITTINNEPESRREWILHRFKWKASQNARNTSHQVWMHGSHAIEINSASFFDQKLNYIHENPVRAGWVEKAEHYIYSSARSLKENIDVHFKVHGLYEQ